MFFSDHTNGRTVFHTELDQQKQIFISKIETQIRCEIDKYWASFLPLSLYSKISLSEPGFAYIISMRSLPGPLKHIVQFMAQRGSRAVCILQSISINTQEPAKSFGGTAP